MLKRNAAYGDWSEEETNWSDKDTDFINKTLRKNNTPIKTNLKEIIEKYKLPAC